MNLLEEMKLEYKRSRKLNPAMNGKELKEVYNEITERIKNGVKKGFSSIKVNPYDSSLGSEHAIRIVIDFLLEEGFNIKRNETLDFYTISGWAE